MPKRVTDAQRLEEIMGRATLEEAQRYLAICGAILRARFPQAVKVRVLDSPKRRKVRSDDAKQVSDAAG